MPLYEIQKKDGTPVRVEGPPNATWSQLVDIYTKDQQRKRQPTTIPTTIPTTPYISPYLTRKTKKADPGILALLNEFQKGTRAGATQMFESAALGAITPFGEETELKAREGIKDFFELDATRPAPGLENSIPRRFGEALGSFGALGITALVPYVGFPLAATTAASAGAGEASERARAYGASQEDRNIAALKGSVVGLSELLPIKLLRVLKPGERASLFRRAYRATASGGIEAGQEAVASILQNAIERGYNPQQDFFEQTGEEAAYGGAVGAFVQGILDLTLRKRGVVTDNDIEQLVQQPKQKVIPPKQKVTPKVTETVKPEQTVETEQETPTIEDTYKNLKGVLSKEGKLEEPLTKEQEFLKQKIKEAIVAKQDVSKQINEEAVGVGVSSSIQDVVDTTRSKDTEGVASSTSIGVGDDRRVARETDGQQKQEDASLKNRSLNLIQNVEPDDLVDTKLTDQTRQIFTDNGIFVPKASVSKKRIDKAFNELKQKYNVEVDDDTGTATVKEEIIDDQTRDATSEEDIDKKDPGKFGITDDVDIDEDVESKSNLTSDLDEYIQERKKLINNKAVVQEVTDTADALGIDVTPDEFKSNLDPLGKKFEGFQAFMKRTGKGIDTGPVIKGKGRKFEDPNKVIAEANRKLREKKEGEYKLKVIEDLQKNLAVKPKTDKEGVNQYAMPEVGKNGKAYREEVDPKDPKKIRINDPATYDDFREILSLTKKALTTRDKQKPIGKAQMYFQRSAYPQAVLDNIASDIAEGSATIRTTDFPRFDKEFYKGTGATNALLAKTWVSEKLSKEANAYLNDKISKELKEYQEAAVMHKSNVAAEYAKSRQIPANVGAKIRESAKNKDPALFKKALLELMEAKETSNYFKNANRTVEKLLRRLINDMGEPNVFVVKDATKLSREIPYGAYDPKTNTIYLNSNGGMNVHVIMHELIHAVTYKALRNTTSPFVNRLKLLHQDVKNVLGGDVNISKLDDFLSEALTNVRFRSTLQEINSPRKEAPTIKVSLWDRFKNNIVGFLNGRIGGESNVKPTTVFDESMEILENLIAPSQEVAEGKRLNFTPIRKFMRNIQEVADNFPKPSQTATKEYIEESLGILGSMSRKGRDIFFKFLPSNAVSDFADNAGISEAYTMDTLLRGQQGDINKAQQSVEGTIESIKSLVPKANVDKFNEMTTDATRLQVDPTLSRKQAVDKYGQDTENFQNWEIVKREYEALNSDSKQAFKLVVAEYKSLFEKLKKTIEGKINNLTGEDGSPIDQGTKNKLKNQIFSKLFEKAKLEPYIPLVRKGQYWLAFDVFDEKFNKEERVVMAFESVNQRRRAVKRLQSGYGVQNIESFEKPSQYNRAYKNPPSTSFMAEMLKVLDGSKTKIPQETRDSLLQLFIEALPESSFAKSFAKREGTLGYNQDIIYGLKTKGYDLARQIEKIRYADLFRKEIDRLLDIRADRDSTKGAIIESLIERGRFAMNPPPDALAILGNRFAFTFTLGLNASSAIVNLSQIPLVMAPMLGGRFGYLKASKAFINAARFYTNSGFSNKIRLSKRVKGSVYKDVAAAPSIDNYFQLDAQGNYQIKDSVLKDGKYSKGFIDKLKTMQKLVEVAEQQGQLNRSIFFDTLGIEGTKRGTGILDRFQIISAGMFHQVERFNRQIALMGSYDLELDRLTKKPKPSERALTPTQKQQRAAEYAVYNTQLINGGALLDTAPPIAQQGIGRVAMMYKGFGIMMYYNMFKTARALVKNAYTNPEEQAIAFRQLVGMVGSSLFLAGVGGLPMYGVVTMIADLFLDDDEPDADTLVRMYVGEGWYKGAVTTMSGADVSTRIGLSNLLFRSNPYQKEWSPEVFTYELLLGPAGSVGRQIYNGFKEIMSEDGNMGRGIENMLPAAIRNARKAFRYSEDEDQVLTRRGQPIVQDVTLFEKFITGFGFGFNRLTQAQTKARVSKQLDTAINAKRSKLLRMWNNSILNGDVMMRAETELAMMDFNIRHPFNAIDMKTLIRSRNKFVETSQKMQFGVLLTEKNREAINSMLSTFEILEDSGLFPPLNIA